MGRFYPLLAWSVMAGLCLVACQKNDVLSPNEPTPHTLVYNQCPGGGEKESDLILDHSVVTSTNDPISGAVSSLWVDGRSTPEAIQTTDVNGVCSFQDSNTCYYLTTEAAGYQKDTSGVFYLSKDTSITVTLEPI